jgi:hypothetical protein
MSEAAVASVHVEIVHTATDSARATSSIDYRVRNLASRRIWVVSDPWFVWQQKTDTVTISFARAPMVAGVEVFGYFDPDVVPLDPDASIDKRLEISWPLQLNTIWNREPSVWPAAGRYRVRVEIGFGFTPHPTGSDGEDVEDAVLDWQHRALSDAGELEVPPK